jgi:hypothetical protein
MINQEHNLLNQTTVTKYNITSIKPIAQPEYKQITENGCYKQPMLASGL